VNLKKLVFGSCAPEPQLTQYAEKIVSDIDAARNAGK
jgi:hypothetical protein